MAKFAAKDSNKDITLSPHGSGKIKLGTGAATATVESDGNHNISIRTGNSTTGTITIVDGADGNIEISPDNQGAVVLGSGVATATVKSDGNHNLSLKTGNSTTGTITIVDGADGNIEISPDNNGAVVVGSGSQDGVIKSDGDQNLRLETGNSTTGSITITDGANGPISLSPNGTGSVEVNTALQVDNIKIDNYVISNTSGNGDIDLTPSGTGEVNITKVDIDSGAIDGVTIGTNQVVTDLRVDNLKIDGSTISSTDTSGDINITPDGSGAANIQNPVFSSMITSQKDAIVDGSTAISRSGNNLTFAGTVATGAGITIPDGSTIGSASDTDAISISSAGLVVDSARPYFQYIGAGNDAESITNGSKAQFDVLVAERGSNYSTSGFYFQTPVAGVYEFIAQLYTYNSTGTLQQWKIESNNTSDADGTLLTTTRVGNPNIGDIIRLSWIGYVPADRRISVKNNSGGTRILYMNATAHSQFMGALIG